VRHVLFVYNADGTVFGRLSDAAHKAFAPRSYQCHLCGLTYGLVKEKRRWRSFVSSLEVPTTFLHRDEFKRRYPSRADEALPAVFAETGEKIPELLISASELNATHDLAELEELVSQRVATLK
jgi:hypothetical protein